jgi:hypothetical protein
VTAQLDLMPGALAAEPAARHDDPETSKAAAVQARTLAGEQNARILAALARLPGNAGTYYEVAAEAGLTPIQVARRLGHRGGLVGAGFVEATEDTRGLPTGRSGRIYRLGGVSG